MDKPIFYYDPLVKPCQVNVGMGAIIWPLTHNSRTVSLTKHILTSPVIRNNDLTGEFETENSIYKPRKA